MKPKALATTTATTNTTNYSIISYISQTTSLIQNSTSKNTHTLINQLPKITSITSPTLTT
jgi:hypothetical protein